MYDIIDKCTAHDYWDTREKHKIYLVDIMSVYFSTQPSPALAGAGSLCTHVMKVNARQMLPEIREINFYAGPFFSAHISHPHTALCTVWTRPCILWLIPPPGFRGYFQRNVIFRYEICKNKAAYFKQTDEQIRWHSAGPSPLPSKCQSQFQVKPRYPGCSGRCLMSDESPPASL